MENDESLPNKNPWSNLSTVKTFDKGENSCPTKYIRGTKRNKNIKTLKKISTSSILINSLISQLCKILEKDPIQSDKLYFILCDSMYDMKLIDPLYKLNNIENVQKKYMNAVCHLITVARSIIGSENSLPYSRSFVSYLSPYKDQFIETGFIASGGFGNVFKAIHKLDEVEYAIKKIVVCPGKIKNVVNHLEEVKTLAKLNHNNIVSYKQAWIEPMSTSYMPQLEFTDKLKNINSCKIGTYKNKSITENHSNLSCESKNIYQFLYKSSNKIKVGDSKDVESNSYILFEKELKGYENEASNEIIEISSNISSEESISGEESFENHKICPISTYYNQYAILYIQMTLCEKTLRHWLDERVEPTPISTTAAVATQILCGLNYIHSLKIVHHDIKPSNIFISTSGKLRIQLGDFGLACPLQRDSHDAIIGTSMYAAPEQLKGECNPKSDIYSLGIVLLEVLIPMQTSMECIKMVECLKAGEIPTLLNTSYPKWANTISQLIQYNPTKRPSTDELIEEFRLDKDLTISKLEDENYKLQNENNKLQNENKNKDQIIENQKKEIEELKKKLVKLKNEDE